jgi:hypothetical protein
MTYRGRRTARGIAVAALALACAGCSHVLPLGPAPAASRQLGSPIILQLVAIQPQAAAGGCPAGYTTLSAPFTNYPEIPDACYRKLGQPVTVTFAAVTMAYQPAINQQPATYGLNFTLAGAEARALATLTTKAFDSRDPMAISTAGKTWGVPMTAEPLSNGQFEIGVQTEAQALQLEHTVMSST